MNSLKWGLEYIVPLESLYVLLRKNPLGETSSLTKDFIFAYGEYCVTLFILDFALGGNGPPFAGSFRIAVFRSL